jgi:hypothetical protein
MGNQEWTIKRQWQHCAHKTQDQHKTTGAIKNGQSRDNGNIRHTRPAQIKHKIEHVQHRQLKRRVTRTSPHNQV